MNHYLRNIIKYIFLFILICSTHTIFAQEVKMADVMRSNGKIYVVVATLSLILVVVLGYLISLDLKIRKLEKENK